MLLLITTRGSHKRSEIKEFASVVAYPLLVVMVVDGRANSHLIRYVLLNRENFGSIRHDEASRDLSQPD